MSQTVLSPAICIVKMYRAASVERQYEEFLQGSHLMHGLEDLLWHATLPRLGSCIKHLMACHLGGPERYTALLYFRLKRPRNPPQLKRHPCRSQLRLCSHGSVWQQTGHSHATLQIGLADTFLYLRERLWARSARLRGALKPYAAAA